MRRTRFTLVGALVVAAVTGCADQPPAEERTAEASGVVGTWTAPDPEGDAFEVTFDHDGAWVMFDGHEGSVGSYSVEGDAITVRFPEGGWLDGTVRGETIVFSAGPDGETTTFVLKTRAIDRERLNAAKNFVPDVGTLGHVMIDGRDPAYVLVTGIADGATAFETARLQETAASDEAIELLAWETFKPNAQARLAERIAKDEYGMVPRLGGGFLLGVQNHVGTPIGLTWNGGIARTAAEFQHARETYAAFQADPDAYAARPRPEHEVVSIDPDFHLPMLTSEMVAPEKKNLNTAAEAGDLEEVSRWLEEGEDVDRKGDRGSTPLHAAAGKGHLDVATLLIGKGADVKAKAETGDTPLHEAVSGGHLDVARLLICKGARVDARDLSKHTPLYDAASNGHLEVVKLLIAEGAKIDARCRSGDTPLYGAVNGKHHDVAAYLLRKGADANVMPPPEPVPPGDGFRLVAVGPPRRYVSYAPLHLAAKSGDLGLARLLLQHGAKVDAKASNEMSAIHLAASFGHAAVAELLIENGADVDTKGGDGSTPLRWAAYGGHLAVATLLLHEGASVNARDENGDTPLHAAAGRGRDAMVELLLKKGADVGAKGQFGLTPLHCAVPNVPIMTRLLDAGAEVDARAEGGFTPLDWVARRGDIAAMEFLIRKGADVNAQALDGRTPLYSAFGSGKKGAVEFLRRHGAKRELGGATVERMESANKEQFAGRLIHIKGPAAKLFVAIDPLWLFIEGMCGPGFADLVLEEPIDEVVVWKLKGPEESAVAIPFANGYAVGGYDQRGRIEKFRLMHEAVAVIVKDGIEANSTRRRIRTVIAALFDPDPDEEIDESHEKRLEERRNQGLKMVLDRLRGLQGKTKVKAGS